MFLGHVISSVLLLLPRVKRRENLLCVCLCPSLKPQRPVRRERIGLTAACLLVGGAVAPTCGQSLALLRLLCLLSECWPAGGADVHADAGAPCWTLQVRTQAALGKMGEMRHSCERLMIFSLKRVHEALSIQVRISRSQQTKQQIPCLCRMTPFCSCQNVMNVSEMTADGLRSLTALTAWLSYYHLLDILPDFILCVKSSDLPPLGPDPGTTSGGHSVLLLPFILATFQSVLQLLLLLLPVYFTCCIYLHPTGIFHT